MPTITSGLLAGWKRRDTEHSVVLILQVIEGAINGDDPEIGKVALAISEQQLCSLARDLSRAAGERRLNVWSSGRYFGLDRLIDRIMRRVGQERSAPLLIPHFPRPVGRPTHM